MHLGVIADDFTGASDIANTLARGGLSTVQFLGLQHDRAPETCEAGVVALKTRSSPASDAVAQAEAALEWLKAQGCSQFVFKYCSTFDSTPRGNIGPVAEALARKLGVYGVVACPAFPTTGRTVYQGHLFVGSRPLNESGLESHPLNPMTDSDIRRWLAMQSNEPVGLVSWFTVRKGAVALRQGLEEAAGRKERLVVVDSICDDDLLTIAQACADAPLLTGGSGIALGLPQNLIRRAIASGRRDTFKGAKGPAAILAGSCSAATLEQIRFHCRNHPALEIAVDDVMRGTVHANNIVQFIFENEDKAPIVFSSGPPELVHGAQQKFGRDKVSSKLEALFAEAAKKLVKRGVKRLVIAGGETSGAVVTALKLKVLAIGPEIDPGVPALTSTEGSTLALALKSGNFGAHNFFEKALRILGGDHG